jgi:hypothetical protein
VVDKVALGQVFLLVLQFCPAIIIPQILHIYFHLNTTIMEAKPGQPSNKASSFGYWETLDGKVLPHLGVIKLNVSVTSCDQQITKKNEIS